MNGTIKKQVITDTKAYTARGVKYRATINIRHDDSCKNGHNSFGMTVDVYRVMKNGRLIEDSFGCQHDLVAKHWPEYAHLIKWHLASTDGPMHYVANTTYLAGDEGKAPELDAARRAAIAPDAALEQLTDPVWLADRLPGLLADFRADVEKIGLVW
tara:strand:+ start:81 stop:548 length:468 start_codon:yes stop_codon:yes gene_type:complete